jgi:fatty-acyl-CoA synthase
MNYNLSYVSGPSDKPLLGLTIGEMLDQIVEKFPERNALIVHHQNVVWNYRTFANRVVEVARALMALGIKKGDRVGIWSLNNSEWTLTQFATAKIGAILVNINPNYRTHELKYALNKASVKLLITQDRSKYMDYTGMIQELAPELTKDEPELHSEELPFLRKIVRLHEKDIPGMMSWWTMLKYQLEVSEEDVKERQSSLNFDDPINIQFTSGTTGFPKGATLSHHNILNNGYFIAERMNITEDDNIVIPVPLYHCFGMVIGNLGCVTHGATMIYPSDLFDAEAVLKAVEKDGATGLYGVPTMFIAELEHPDFKKFDLSTLRTGVMAGSPCPIEVMKQVKSDMHMSEVQIAYGMTETSPVSTQTKIGTPLEKQVSTVGQVHPHLEIKIIDPESGKVVPFGKEGELCTRGYSVMKGYWDDDVKTEEAIDADGWMHSGDLAVMDEEQYINIVGRIKDMIIRGGENIYPREIEEFLYTNPKVSDVQVIGVPSEKFGEEVMAWIKLKEGEQATEEEMLEFCKGKIAHFKIPRFIKFVDHFPMTVTGKIRKVEMRTISIEELELEKAAGIKMA